MSSSPPWRPARYLVFRSALAPYQQYQMDIEYHHFCPATLEEMKRGQPPLRMLNETLRLSREEAESTDPSS